MNAIEGVVMTESAITFPELDPGKPHIVVFYRKNCIQNIPILCKATKLYEYN